MIRKLGLVVASMAAVGVIFAGASFACGGKSKSAAQHAANKANCDKNCSAQCKAACDKMSAADCAKFCGSYSMQGASTQMAIGSSCGSAKNADANSASLATVAPAVGSSSSSIGQVACGGGSKSASSTKMACGSGSSKSATKDHAGCGTSKNSSWASALCGEKGYYAANVYEVKDGHMWAVSHGQKFEVTSNTPFIQVGQARYYFPDATTEASCKVAVDKCTSQIDQEAVSLAMAEGNVVGQEDGKKIARCMVTGKQFVVTADQPVRVVDGKKYYLGREEAQNTSMHYPAN